MTGDAGKIEKGLDALCRRLDGVSGPDRAALDDLLKVWGKRRETIVGIVRAADHADAGDMDLCFHAAETALESAGVSRELLKAAQSSMALAIGCNASEIDLDDMRSMLDEHGRAGLRAGALSHFSRLKVGIAGTAAGAAIMDHFRDQLSGKPGALDHKDPKAASMGDVERRKLSAVERCRVARRAGEIQREGSSLAPRSNRWGIETCLGFALWEFWMEHGIDVSPDVSPATLARQIKTGSGALWAAFHDK
jgi:hypothetical protein